MSSDLTLENSSDAILTHQEVNRVCGKTDPSDNVSMYGTVAGLNIQHYQTPARPTVASIDNTANGIGDLITGSVLNGNVYRHSFVEDPVTHQLSTVSFALEISNLSVLAEYKAANSFCPGSKILGVAGWGIGSREARTIYLLVKDSGNSCASPPLFDIQQIVNGGTTTWLAGVASAWNPVENMAVDGSGQVWGATGQTLWTIAPGNIQSVYSTGNATSSLGKPSFSFGNGSMFVVDDEAVRSCTALDGAVWSNVSGTFSPLISLNVVNDSFPNACNVRITSAVMNATGDRVYAYDVSSSTILELGGIGSTGLASDVRIFLPGALVREKLSVTGQPSIDFTSLLMGQEERVYLYTSTLPNVMGVTGNPFILMMKNR